ncbi:ABC transporter permease subunit [Verrucomicrobiaceae bacterium N1E253]|uniref:ABC transporter permease subunit n=1 Tax=Oceaniferula marina TaxID=2748318 RepID=A0A851GPT9_9BACT|nr:ABC transporter permease subunit [Oceaniferula marina]NWK57135.1 ABC transporter permease subunit [Oceaniferula marina]
MRARLFHLWCLVCTCCLILTLGGIVFYLVSQSLPYLNGALFFGDTPVWDAISGKTRVWGALWPACVGTFSVTIIALLIALLPGIATGIWLAEFPRSRFSTGLGLAIDVLAGTPSVLMGLFGFTMILFLREHIAPAANHSLLLSASCLAILILPYLASTTRTAMQSVPLSLRISTHALGMNHWQRIWYVLLPRSTKGILSGIMLSFGRAAEDTAVIMLTGAVASAGLPSSLLARYEALPFSIFYYSAQYQTKGELGLAFGASVTLMCLTATTFAITGMVYQQSLSPHHD